MVGSDQYYQMHHRAVTAKGSYSTRDGRVLACVGEVDQGDFMQLPPVDRLPLFEPLPWDAPSMDDLEKSSSNAHRACADAERPKQPPRNARRARADAEHPKQSDKDDVREQRYRYECYWGQQRWRDADIVTCPVVGLGCMERL